MMTSPTGKGVIVMGGRKEGRSGKNSEAMFELTQSMEWTRLEQTLQIEHYGGLLAIPIPDEMVKIVKPKKKSTKMTKKLPKITLKNGSRKKLLLKI